MCSDQKQGPFSLSVSDSSVRHVFSQKICLENWGRKVLINEGNDHERICSCGVPRLQTKGLFS